MVNREKGETVTDFLFLGSKITVDNDCSHEIKRCLLLRRKAMTNLDSIFKSRHYFAYKHPYRQSYCFSNSHVRIWELDNKKGWALQNWSLQTVVLKKTSESPLNSKEIKPVNSKGNQSWIFIRRTDADLKLQHFSYLMRRTNSFEKTLMLGKFEGRRRRSWQRMRWLDSITDSMGMNLSKLWEIVRETGKPGVLQSM